MIGIERERILWKSSQALSLSSKDSIVSRLSMIISPLFLAINDLQRKTKEDLNYYEEKN